MRMNEYQKLANRTANKDLSKRARLTNGCITVTTEGAEALDYLKKAMFQGHGLNNQKVIEELGDALWGIAEAATALGVSMAFIADCNVQKLKRRYPAGFSTKASVNRDE